MSERAKVGDKKPVVKRENSISRKQSSSLSQSISSPVDQILLLQRTVGNQVVQRLFNSGAIQAKLTIGQPGDKYEQEADRVAEQIMRMPEPRIQGQVEPEGEEILQIKSLADQITPLIQRQVDLEEEEEKKEEEKEFLQTKLQSGPTPEVTRGMEARINSLRGGGQPLPRSVRNFFEPRFGYDFSRVRVHTDAQAAEMARAVDTRAFTLGRNIVFGAGQYAPGTTEGKQLLTHELTHIVQQGQGSMVLGRDIVQREEPTSQLASEPKVPLPKQVLNAVNAQRGALGNLTWNDKLALSAATYCGVITSTHMFSHTADGSTVFKRVRAAKYFPVGGGGTAGENLYRNQKAFSANDAVTWWMGSPPHRAQIMEPCYEDAAVAICSGTIRISGVLQKSNIVVMHFGAIHPTLTASKPAGKRIGGSKVNWTITGTVSDNLDSPASIVVRVSLQKTTGGLTVAKLPTHPVKVGSKGSFSFTFETNGTGSAKIRISATDSRGNAPVPETRTVKVNPLT